MEPNPDAQRFRPVDSPANQGKGLWLKRTLSPRSARSAPKSAVIFTTWKSKVKTWRARLAHINATIKIFSLETDPEAIPPRRTYCRSNYFKRGEFARLCLDELRKADGRPITAATIVGGIIKAKGDLTVELLYAALSDL